MNFVCLIAVIRHIKNGYTIVIFIISNRMNVMLNKNTTNLNNKENIVYVFIDASNVWSIIKSARRFIEYKFLRDFFMKECDSKAVEIFYYDAYPKNGTREYDMSAKHKFLTYLKKGLGFNVKKKELKRISTIDGEAEVVIEKGNMDVEIVIDALHNKGNYNIAIFFTGDCDFLPLVTYLRKNNKKVYIFSSKDSISHELKTGGDGYFDLRRIDEIWGKELKHRDSIVK